MGGDGEGICASLQHLAASEAMAKAWNCIGVIMRGTSRSLKATAHHAGRGIKATVLDCMGGDGEGICASLQA